MTDTSVESPSSKKDWDRMREETVRSELYCHEDHKGEWKEEADQEGVTLSRYLYDLIQEARSYRQGGLPVIASKDERVEELQSRIEELQDELDETRAQNQTGTRITVDDLVDQELTGQCQTIDELLEDIKASDRVTQHLRRRLEDRLFSLAEEGRAEFQRGHGWRLNGDK